MLLPVFENFRRKEREKWSGLYPHLAEAIRKRFEVLEERIKGLSRKVFEQQGRLDRIEQTMMVAKAQEAQKQLEPESTKEWYV